MCVWKLEKHWHFQILISNHIAPAHFSVGARNVQASTTYPLPLTPHCRSLTTGAEHVVRHKFMKLDRRVSAGGQGTLGGKQSWRHHPSPDRVQGRRWRRPAYYGGPPRLAWSSKLANPGGVQPGSGSEFLLLCAHKPELRCLLSLLLLGSKVASVLLDWDASSLCHWLSSCFSDRFQVCCAIQLCPWTCSGIPSQLHVCGVSSHACKTSSLPAGALPDSTACRPAPPLCCHRLSWVSISPPLLPGTLHRSQPLTTRPILQTLCPLWGSFWVAAGRDGRAVPGPSKGGVLEESTQEIHGDYTTEEERFFIGNSELDSRNFFY